ncbi:SDR family NAD(P)-dependent oxidoreductase [Bacillus sp. JCM 19041]|uniref:SDR family NAD(P)-dependent oxidoreductase n=1 Tax=Bacillus sp. JCM 19041 TaxID=1460637 RepID=UPI000AAF65C7
MPDLTNHVILITGANRGQGKGIAKHLATLGAKVAVGARNVEDAEQVVKEIGENHAMPLKLDVTQEKDWELAVQSIVTKYNRLDVLINNAGV